MKGLEKLGRYGSCAIDKIVVRKDSLRKDLDNGGLKDLTESIKGKGIIVPLIVRGMDGNKNELVCGERRLAAAKKLNFKMVPVEFTSLSDEEAAEIRIIENLQRSDVNIVDEAAGYAEMIKKFKYTQEDLASKVGKSSSYISGRLMIMELSKEVLTHVRSGVLTPAHVKVLLRVKDVKSQEGLVEEIINDDMSARQAESSLCRYLDMSLKYAKFDKKNCADCEYNGDKQKDFLDEDTDLSGYCLKSSCYKKKQAAWMAERKKDIKKKGYQIITEKEFQNKFKHYYQATAMTEKIEKKLGDVYKTKCMKCKSLFKIICTNHDGQIEIQEKCARLGCPSMPKDTSGNGSYDSGGGDKRRQKEIRDNNRVQEATDIFYKKQISSKVGERELMSIVLQAVIDDRFRAGEFLGVKTANSYNVTLAEVYKASENKLPDLFRKAGLELLDGADPEDIDFLKSKYKIELKKEFEITKEYLDDMDKEQMVALSKEIGLDEFLQTKKKLDPKKMYAGKAEQLQKLFLESGYDLTGKVPKEILEKEKS